MNLHEFLVDGSGPAPPVNKSKFSNWADEPEEDEYGYTSRKQEPVVLPTAPRAARDASINEENIPMHPPFVAYISNLPYEVDEEDLAEFLKDMRVSNMRLPKLDSKMKGYGYVEFEDRQSLVAAINMTDTTLKARRVRIEVSNSSNDDRRRMGRMGDSRGRDWNDEERTTGDWRSARAERMDDDERDGGRDDRFRSRGFGGRDDNRDSGFEDSRPGNWRDGPREPASSMDRPRRDDRGGGGERDWNRFADRGRGPPRDGSRERDEKEGERGGDRDGDRFGDRGSSRFGDRGGDRFGDRGGDRFGDRGGDRFSDRRGDRFGDRGGDRDSSFGPSRRNFNDDDRDKERWSSIRSQPREPVAGDDPPAAEAPRTRPKLELQPRSKPIEPIVVTEVEKTEPVEASEAEPKAEEKPVPKPVPAANIFGAAKPVDTAAREREIEARIAKSAEARPKEEVDDKRSGPREGAWGRRNGEGRSYDQERSQPPAWRSQRPDPRDNRDPRDGRDSRDHRDNKEPGPRDGSRDSRSNSKGPPSTRGPAGAQSRGPAKQTESRPPPDGAEKEKKREEDELSRMPKAKDNEAPNFIASNKYSMLPDDVDPDNLEE
ncbi:hypothetical protein QAD02_010562 [Eretmocerus hayati]|uniref:Uncharacterized protein n=1 Tax=Eretmocerus hayati TaxID=131215 RepID=A0ACC2NVG6_9HYME|nr:hypothetical protein QAD02_010562 [Eretmocerus hayati]